MEDHQSRRGRRRKATALGEMLASNPPLDTPPAPKTQANRHARRSLPSRKGTKPRHIFEWTDLTGRPHVEVRPESRIKGLTHKVFEIGEDQRAKAWALRIHLMFGWPFTDSEPALVSDTPKAAFPALMVRVWPAIGGEWSVALSPLPLGSTAASFSDPAQAGRYAAHLSHRHGSPQAALKIVTDPADGR